MQLVNSPSRYGAIPQALHWLTAICVIAGWLLGQFIDAFPKGPPRAFAFWTHMTLGECVMVFLVARLIWRFANPPPPVEPTQFGRPLEIASRVSHWALYLLLIAVPVRRHRRAAQARQRIAGLRTLGCRLAVASGSGGRADRSRCALISGECASDPRRHPCLRGAAPPLCIPGSHAGADAAGLHLEHDPEKACPGLDPGWIPVFGKDHAPTDI